MMILVGRDYTCFDWNGEKVRSRFAAIDPLQIKHEVSANTGNVQPDRRGTRKRLNMVLLRIREQRALSVIRKSALSTCLLLGAAMAAMGQSRQESLDKCRSADSDTKISGCTALIQASQDTRENLSVIYNNRGSAYDDKGDYDHAIQDFNEAIHLKPEC
jgi:tetratricopeptide (TPR) repeat protein